MSKTICVFCSSSDKIPKKYFHETEKLGKLFKENKYNLIWGGNSVGLMRAVGDSVRISGGKTIAILSKQLAKEGITYENADELVLKNTLVERELYLQNNADAFIILPGGFGTIQEIGLVITSKLLSEHNKPIVILNMFGYFDNLIEQMEVMYRESAVKKESKKAYAVVKTPKEAIKYINNYKPMVLPRKWF